MSSEDLAKTVAAVKSVTREAITSREKALALMVKIGIVTPDGKLTEHYKTNA